MVALYRVKNEIEMFLQENERSHIMKKMYFWENWLTSLKQCGINQMVSFELAFKINKSNEAEIKIFFKACQT